jgi:hypothetical protein
LVVSIGCVYAQERDLEHLNFLCMGLGRREDFGRQGRKRKQCYSLLSISNAAGQSRNRHKPYTKNLIALDGPGVVYMLIISHEGGREML